MPHPFCCRDCWACASGCGEPHNAPNELTISISGVTASETGAECAECELVNDAFVVQFQSCEKIAGTDDAYVAYWYDGLPIASWCGFIGSLHVWITWNATATPPACSYFDPPTFTREAGTRTITVHLENAGSTCEGEFADYVSIWWQLEETSQGNPVACLLLNDTAVPIHAEVGVSCEGGECTVTAVPTVGFSSGFDSGFG